MCGACVCQLTVDWKNEQKSATGSSVWILRKVSIETVPHIQIEMHLHHTLFQSIRSLLPVLSVLNRSMWFRKP